VDAASRSALRHDAEPNLFGESSDAPGREHNNQKGAHGGNWFPP